MAGRLNQSIRLRDGSALGYAEVGDVAGRPVFHFHGWPGSRLEAALFEFAGDLAACDIRLIALDRPGFGLSDFQPARRILDWPEDVLQLADALGIDRFAVQGWSGGGPYIAACAYKIPDRLTACSFIAGIGPPNVGKHKIMSGLRYLFPAARWMPWLLNPMVWLIWGRAGRDQARMEAALGQIQGLIAERDRQLYARPEVRRLVAASMVESFRQGTRGSAYDARLLGQPWGFQLQDIRHRHVFVWHGEQDTNVPLSFGRLFASQIPGSQATFFPDDGHLSIILDHGMEIVPGLVN